MPRMHKPKKDVLSHESRRVAAKKRRSGGVRIGKPLLYRRLCVFDTWRERPELKHLSKGRKRNRRDPVSKRRAKAGEPKPRRKALGLRGW
jgi:hypothetical protein